VRARAVSAIASICAALLALVPGSAHGLEVVDRADVELAWTPASGPVDAYVVFVSRDGGPYRSELHTTLPRAHIGGQPGETVQVRVRAYRFAGARTLRSEPSPPSEAIHFVESTDGPFPVSAAPPPGPAESREAPQSFSAPALSIRAGGDFDGDGGRDLLATLGSWRHPLALYSRDGTLETLACLAPLDDATAAFGADFAGDGRDELFLHSGDTVSLERLDRPGTTTLLRREVVPSGARVLPADLDRAAVASLVVYEPASGRLSERFASGASTELDAVRPLHALRAGDFDGDGRDDLWVRPRAGGESELWLMREEGRYVVAPLRFDGEASAPGEVRAWLLDGARVIDRRALGRAVGAPLRALDLDDYDGRDDLLVSAPSDPPG
jgi:hypothetical protein